MADTGSPRMASNPLSLSRPRKLKRWVLLTTAPLLAVIIATYFYLTGGRYVGTDDAYVHTPNITVSTDISGRVVRVFVGENVLVKEGDALFQLDEEPLKIALAQAQANLDDIRNSIIALKATYQQRQEDLKAASSTYEMTEREFERRQKLVTSKIISASEFDEARNQYEVAASRQAAIRQDINQILSQLGGNPGIEPEEHARFRSAKAQLDKAALDLSRATIYAKGSGITIHSDRLQPGDYVKEGQPVFALVDQAHPWIEANLKETDLTHVAPGQPVTIQIDTYPGLALTGIVDSIGAATGSEFSALPAQNATGNWVKVVQRIPVRLHLMENPQNRILRAGMSTSIEIDTGHARSLGDLLHTIGSWVGFNE